MNDKFFDLKKEKQDRMINAALKIFAENGYKRASTDDIVKEAGISKGLLFHYFESKIGLFEFLFDYSAKFLMLELSGLSNGQESDYFTVCRQLIGTKVQIMRNYPYLCLFLSKAAEEKTSDFSVDLYEKIGAYREFEASFFKKVKQSSFSEHADYNKVKTLIDYTIQGTMEREFKEGTFETDKYYEEVIAYLEMMRMLCYK